MTMDQREYDAIVIGAGHNGLVTAYYLARDGLSVLVLERIERIGGAIGTEELYPGFHVPYCAYICHMLHGRIIDELELRRHGFDLYPVDPWSFHPFPDGTHLLGWQDTRRFAREIRKLSEPDADAFLDWTLFWDRACGIVRRYFLSDPPTFAEVAADLRGTADEEVWETLLTVSMRELVEQHFEDPRVRAYFINAQDAGDPSAPGSALSVAYIRSGILGRSEDRGIPKGGMGRVSEAMAAAARARGARSAPGSPSPRSSSTGATRSACGWGMGPSCGRRSSCRTPIPSGPTWGWCRPARWTRASSGASGASGPAPIA